MTPALLSASAPTAAGALAFSLGRAALEGGALVLVVAAIVRAFPRLNAATRTALWWLACLRLVAGLVAWPAPSLPLPALTESPRELVRTSLAATPQFAPAGAAFARFTRPVDTESRERTLAWSDVTRLTGTLGRAAAPGLLVLWACGVLAVLALHLLAAHRARGLWSGAAPLEHAQARAWLVSWLGERAAARIDLRVSDEASSPALLAGFRPCILLPASCAALPAAQLRMVLAHEVAHVRRRDLAFGALPAIAHAIFWFHPLAHWAVEEYAQSREEACDADAVRACDAPPCDYGELLLAYGIDRRPAAGVAVSYGSRCASQLHRRIRMLASLTRPTRTQRTLALAALIVVGLVAMRPVRLVAGTRTTPSAASTTTTRTSTSSGSSYASSTSTGGEHHQRETFAYGYSKGANLGVLNVSGSFETGELERLESLGKSRREGFGWFRLGDQEYLVTDPVAVARMAEIMAPQDELGRRQGELGERQGEIGARQGELGDRQAELSERMSAMSEQVARLSSELDEDGVSEARRTAIRLRIAALEKQTSELDAQQEALSKRQDELAAKQDALGARQEELGARQEALGKRVDAEMRKLAQEWARDGRAERAERR